MWSGVKSKGTLIDLLGTKGTNSILEGYIFVGLVNLLVLVVRTPAKIIFNMK